MISYIKIMSGFYSCRAITISERKEVDSIVMNELKSENAQSENKEGKNTPHSQGRENRH